MRAEVLNDGLGRQVSEPLPPAREPLRKCPKLMREVAENREMGLLLNTSWDSQPRYVPTGTVTSVPRMVKGW